VTILWDLKAIVLRELRVFFIATRLRQSRVVFLIVNIGDTLEKQKRKNVRFEVRCVDRTAQYVGSFPKVRLQLTERE
jgi:hypothetical protein